MKSKHALIAVCALCVFSIAEAQTAVDSFWDSFLEGNYQEAAKIGARLGSGETEYYVLSGISYTLLGDEYRAYRMQRRYYFESEPSGFFISEGPPVTDMGFLLESREKENKDNFRIYVLEGIVAGMYPNFYLKETPKTYLEKSLTLSPNPFAYNYLAFISNLAQGQDAASAIDNAQKAIKMKPDYGAAYVNLAGAYYRKGEKDKSLDALLECLVKCPNPPEQAFQSLYNMVSEEVVLPLPGKQKDKSFRTMGIADSGICSRIIETLKSNPGNYLGFAELYIKQGNTREPAKFLDGLESTQEQKGLRSYLEARVLYLNEDFKGFDKLAQKIVESHWDDYKRLYEIGNLYYEQGKADRALESVTLGVEQLDPMDLFYKAKLSSLMTLCLLTQKDTSKARLFLDDAVNAHPDDATTCINLGIAYYQLNEKEQSKRMFLKAYNYKPTPEQRSVVDSYLDEKLKP